MGRGVNKWWMGTRSKKGTHRGGNKCWMGTRRRSERMRMEKTMSVRRVTWALRTLTCSKRDCSACWRLQCGPRKHRLELKKRHSIPDITIQ